MTEECTRLLCSGDLHIGRRPSRLPRHVDGRRFATKRAWDVVVDTALENDVHAVVLTGDIVDRANRYYEALGPLERGLRRLGEENVQVFAVAGNHDFDVFPEIVDSLGIEGFHLLGARGTWAREPLLVEGDDDPRLYLDGWSFSGQYESTSPLASYDLPNADTPVVGVLHCEVDAGPEGRYAPVESGRLARAGPDLWLLGHIHVPRLERTETEVPYLYPGSPQPLDPGETGPHGPWMIEVSPGGEVEAEHFPTATVRYEVLDVDLDGVEAAEEVRTALHERIREALREDLADADSVEHLVCRPRLQGRTLLHGDLSDIVSGASAELELPLDGTTATVDKISVETRPDLDLEALARTSSPPGELARIVRALDEGEESDQVAALLAEVRERVREVDRSGTYAPVFDHDEELEKVDRVDLADLVRQQALLLIEALERQKRGDGE